MKKVAKLPISPADRVGLKYDLYAVVEAFLHKHFVVEVTKPSRKRKSPEKNPILEKIAKAGHQLTLEESLALEKWVEETGIYHIAPEQRILSVHWYVPPEIWERFSEEDRKRWPQRGLVDGFIPVTQWPHLIDAEKRTCASACLKEHSVWEYYGGRRSCFLCRKKQRVRDQKKRAKAAKKIEEDEKKNKE